ncbi:hypothetical protein [Changchengzhania lutea]|uniref:hypothetical protein n=1 Tax=Changchengzhania lutea TaxID=2049305 RepID=UPI00115CEEF4|nr:hypothetical protein [Changchengzhania lutea]
MKKQKLKNYLRIGILIFGISLFFQSCSKDEIIDLQEFKNNNLIVETVSLNEIESNPLFSSIISTKSSKIDIYKSKTSSTSKSTNDYSILTDDISKASYKEYEAYTFRIKNPTQPLFTFDNYVIQKNHDGTIEEFILRYEYDQLEFVKNNSKKFLSVSKFDTDYNFISSSNDTSAISGKSSSKGGLSAKSSGGCTVTFVVYHRIPDGREFVYGEGSVCQHPGECDVIIEYTITCTGGGGGSGTGGDTGGSDGSGGGTDTGGGYVGDVPDNGGTPSPITTMPPPAGQEEDFNVIDVLTEIIEAPLSRIPSEGEIAQKNSALIGYLMETNQPVFQDLSTLLAINLYDSTLNVTDRANLWAKSRAIYDIVKNNNPTIHSTFNMFFSSLDLQEQESYTKNTMETALFSSVKSIVGEFWPQNAEEWGALFKLMGPLLLEIGIEFLPGGGVFNAGKDTLAGLSSGDYTTAVIGVVGIIMEFVPWAKLAKIVSKIYDVGKSAFKIFKLAYNFLGSIATAIENGIKTVLDSNGILKLLDNSGNQVGRIANNVMEVSKHGIKAMDGSVLFRKADDVNAEFIQAGLNAPYKLGKPVTEFVTSETEQFVRVFTEGSTLPDGRWMVKASDIQGMTPTQIQDFLSLPNTPNKIVDVNIPSGTKMRTGEAGDVTQFGTNGGVTQFEIPYPDTFDPSWFSNIQNL